MHTFSYDMRDTLSNMYRQFIYSNKIKQKIHDFQSSSVHRHVRLCMRDIAFQNLFQIPVCLNFSQICRRCHKHDESKASLQLRCFDSNGHTSKKISILLKRINLK